MPHAMLSRKLLCRVESMTRQRNAGRRAGRACTSRISWMESPSDARDPPPEVALAASRRLGSRRKDLPDRHGPVDFFRQRGGQSAVEPAAGKPFGTDDRGQGGVARTVDSMARHAGNHKGLNDPWEGARGHGTSFYRTGSAGGSGHRFLLGQKNFAGGASPPTAARAQPS